MDGKKDVAYPFRRKEMLLTKTRFVPAIFSQKDSDCRRIMIKLKRFFFWRGTKQGRTFDISNLSKGCFVSSVV